MALEWQLKLKDGMSGPAKTAAGSLAGLEKKLGDTAKKAEFFRDKMGKLRHQSGRYATEAEKLAQGIVGDAAKAPKAHKFKAGNTLSKDLASVWGSAGASAGAAFVAAFAAAIAAIVGVVAHIAGQIATFQQGKSKTLFAFDKLLGPGGGEKAWERIRAAANKTKSTLQETAQAFNNLVAAGFSLDQADTLFKQLADLKTLNPQANIDGIVRAIGQIRNIGNLQGDELNQLAEAGVNVGDVYEELGKRLGKTKDEVLKLKEAGKIKADDAIAAIQTAIAKRTGGDPGSVAGKAPKGAAESWERVKQKFFDMVNVDFGPISRFLDRIEKALDGEAGKELAAAFSDLMSAAGEFLDAFGDDSVSGGIKGFAAVVRDIADSLRTIASLARKVNGALGEGGAAKAVEGIWGGLKGGLKGFAIGITGMLAGPIQLAIAGLDIVGWLAEKFMAGLAFTAGQAVAFFDAAVSLGTSLVDGIIAGISQKWDALIAQVSNLGASARDAFGAAIGEGSPAREFYPAGRSIPEGVAVGVEQGGPTLAGAMDNMAVAAMGRAGAGLGASLRARPAQGGGGTTNINMQNPDPSIWDQRMRQIVRQENRRLQPT